MINKKLILIINILFVFGIFFSPNFALAGNNGIDSRSIATAENSLVNCETVEECNWQSFLQTLDKVKNYGVQLVVVLSVIFIVYAGGLYLTSMGNSGKIEQAKSILSNVVIGFFLAAAGWLLVSAILKTLEVKDGFAPGDLLQQNSTQL